MVAPVSVSVFAPAKVNLTLHVTGQRDDGYHLLDSLVSFAGVGDTLTLTERGQGELTVSGPFADHLPADRMNFVLRVAGMFWKPAPISFHLHKELPIASGIGGGSADAAACYRAITRLLEIRNGRHEPAADDMAKLLEVGADVPMCVLSEPSRVQGIGERIAPVRAMPDLPVILVNPGVSVSTSAVFKSLAEKDNLPMSSLPGHMGDRDELVNWLADQRNDLQAAACAAEPVITSVLNEISRTEGCRLARMSGSGATCFGIFGSDAEARSAAARIEAEHPAWWVRSCRLDGAKSSAAQLIRSTT